MPSSASGIRIWRAFDAHHDRGAVFATTACGEMVYGEKRQQACAHNAHNRRRLDFVATLFSKRSCVVFCARKFFSAVCAHYPARLLAAVLLLLCATAWADDFPQPANQGAGAGERPLSAEQAAAGFRLPPGFK
ncbi:MAG TPA: hypothetical protein VFB80_06325, partial [Pirellulaceae bacterium]|nr:hypothetical protein [Pirellulaceae bacterium]